MDHSAKILLLGKTGVGKSAFINYFLGKKVAESAAGKPVTQEYFIPYEVDDGRYPIIIFDTKGLETLEADKQLDQIIQGLKTRNNSDDIFDWFHTIFYCISMATARFEDFEFDFIRRLQKELTQHIHIILTHCDSCSSDTIAQMRNRIIGKVGDMEHIEIFEVVCVSKKKRNGEEVHPYGKEIISERVFDLLLEDIAYKVSLNYARSLRKAMFDGADFALSKTEKFINNTIRLKTLIELIKDEDATMSRIDSYVDQIGQDLESALDNTNQRFMQILQPAAQLYTSYWAAVTDSFVEDVQLEFENFVDIAGFLDERETDFYKALMPNMYRKGYMDESGDFIDTDSDSGAEMIKAILTGMGDLLSIKKNIKMFCKDMHKQFIISIPSESELQKKAYKQIVDFIRSYSKR